MANKDRGGVFGSGRVLLLLAGLAQPGVGLAYSGVADVTLSWGVGGTAIVWSSSAQNSLPVLDNSTRFTTAPGSNGTIYFNPDFAAAADYDPGTDDDCLTLLSGYNAIELRKYGCRQTSSGGNLPVFHPSPVTDAGPAAAAAGTLFFTDTTLTGTLTVLSTTDEPTGGSESSIGDGASGFNLRALDTFAFGNVWFGASTGATLTVDLTGDFSPTSWEITGGTVRLSDPAFQCQQGGIGGVPPDYVLCQISAVPGGLSNDGSNLSFGMDADGGLAGVAMTPVEIHDTDGTSIVASLSGVLASLNVGAGGILSTSFGEYRGGSATNTGGCLSQIRWDGISITCGSLRAGALEITGTATPVDTEPDPFAFTPVTNVALNTEVTSNTVTITGIAAPARITVEGGSYSIGCTSTFSTAAANIPDGSTVCVRHSSAAMPATDTATTLNIGGITGTFTSTTILADTTPDAFAFADQVDVPLNAVITSDAVIITGLTATAPVTVVNGTYSVGCTTYTASPGVIGNGESVCIQHSSSLANSTPVTTTLTIGGVVGTFTSTTVEEIPSDTTPDAFAFADQADVDLSTGITSAPVTISGIDAPAPVSVSGGEYSVGCTVTYTAAAGTISNGQTVCVRHTSAATNNTSTNTTLTVGGVADTFSSTTVAAVPPDTTPDAFAFADQADVDLLTEITSAPVTISGIDAPAPVSVSGGEYSVGCTATFTSAAGTVTNGQTVCVRHTSAATNSTSTSTTLTVGGVADTFSSTTVAAVPPDTTPDDFTFVDQADVDLSTEITSAPVTISGIDAPAPVSVSGGEYSVGCTATFTSAAGTVTNGQTVCVRHTSAAANGTSTSTPLTVGGVSDSFVSTTLAVAGGGGGGSAADPFLLTLLAGLPLWRARGSRRRRTC